MTDEPLPSHAKVAIIRGGVVGCSILFHLAKFGWKDVVLPERDGMLLGAYEPRSTLGKAAGALMDFGHELPPPNLDRIADRLELAFGRIPALANANIRTTVNGPFTFGPNGNPMIGPGPGMTNYWPAVGVMVGFRQAGGVGLRLAEWMIDREPYINVSNDEAVLKDGTCVGYVTSGGYAHHAGKSMALGYGPPALAADGAELEIMGDLYPARVHAHPLYDRRGAKMRS